jgi:hypothetical protein
MTRRAQHAPDRKHDLDDLFSIVSYRASMSAPTPGWMPMAGDAVRDGVGLGVGDGVAMQLEPQPAATSAEIPAATV